MTPQSHGLAPIQETGMSGVYFDQDKLLEQQLTREQLVMESPTLTTRMRGLNFMSEEKHLNVQVVANCSSFEKIANNQCIL